MLASLPEAQRQEILDGLTDEDLEQLEYDWLFWGRPEQFAPDGEWSTWVIDAGRGFGKTRAGAEWVKQQVYAGKKRIALIAETYKDLVEVMCYGESGLVSVFPPHERPRIVANPGVSVTFHTGAIALGYNATQPAQLRGPQFDAAWCDELAKWRYAQETWDMLEFGLRLGDDPRALVTTTPRPIPIMREILSDPDTRVTRGSTFDNAGNLAPKFLRKIRRRYEGTRLGRQELHAEMLDDLPGALWTRDIIEAHRAPALDKDENPLPLPPMRRIVVAVDPSGVGEGDDEDGDSVGILVVGKGFDNRAHVIADRTSDGGPAEWAKAAVGAYHEFKADRIVAERNFGGAMVEHTIRTADATVSYKSVTASRGKVVRAEPVSALYEQGQVSHIGAFPELEDQMCDFGPDGYIGKGSPDRVDALVWAITELSFGGETIFDVPFDRISVAPFPIPAHWKRAYAVERKDGRVAALWGAIDPTDGVIHFYSEHDMPPSTMTLQAEAIKLRGSWMPGMFPVTAPGRSKAEGKALIKEMKQSGLKLRDVHFAEEVTEVVDQVNLGRIKVFSNLTGFEREYRAYQRDENGNLAETGLLMNCFRAWVRSGRNVATTKQDDAPVVRQTTADSAGIY